MKLNLPTPAAALVVQRNKVGKQKQRAYREGQSERTEALLKIVGKNVVLQVFA